MTDKADDITALLSPTVTSMGLELLGIEYLPAPGGATVRLYIDVPQVEGDTITFDVDGAEFAAAAVNIDKARLVPDWVALGLAPAQDKSGRDARPGKQHSGKKHDAAGKAPAAKKNPTNKTAASGPLDAE